MTQADNRRIHPPQEDSAAVCETIMERALALIEATSRRIPDWNPPPFDPRTYAETLGIPVVPAGMPEDWDALYVPVGDQPRIIVKTSGVSPGRQNFSIAH